MRISIPVLASLLLFATTARADQALFTANVASDSVSVYAWGPQTAWEHTFLAEVDVGASPIRLALHALGWEAYVVCRDDSTVWTIDTYTREATLLATGTGVLGDVVADPDLRHIWVSNFHPGKVTRIDIDTGATTDIDIGFTPRRMSMTPDGEYIYVGSTRAIGSPEGAIAEIDTAALWSRTLLSFPSENVMGVGYGGANQVFLGLEDGSKSRVMAIDPDDCDEEWSCYTNEFAVDGGPSDFEIDSVIGLIWMTLLWNSEVDALSSPFGPHFYFDGPGGLAFDHENSWMFVAAGNTDSIDAFHVVSGTVDADPIQLDPGREPRDVVVTAEMPGLVDVAPASLGLGPQLTKAGSVIRNLSNAVTLKTSLYGDSESFIVDDGCNGRFLKPYEECAIQVRCQPGGSLREAFIDIIPSDGLPSLLTLECEPD